MSGDPEVLRDKNGRVHSIRRAKYGYDTDGEDLDARYATADDGNVYYPASARMMAAHCRLKDITCEGVQAIIDDFSVLYYDGGGCGENIGALHQTQLWRGVVTGKMPTDMWVYQEIIMATKPEVIIETGVDCGGSILINSDLVTLEGLDTHLIGIDVDLTKVSPKVRETLDRRGGYTLFNESSTEPKLIEHLQKFCAGKKTMVILDSSHTYEHVKAELEVYPQLVPPGCHLIIEDTLSTYGAERAANEFMENNTDFAVDTWSLRMLLTQSVNSILVRTKGLMTEVPIGG